MNTTRVLIFIAAVLALGFGFAFSAALLCAGWVLFLTGLGLDLYEPRHHSVHASEQLLARQERAAQALLRPHTGLVELAPRERP